MNIIVPRYPFAPEDVADASEFLETLAGLKDELGTNPTDWVELLSDADFGASLASFWAFMAGREPGAEPTALLQEALAVSDAQFTARVQRGTSPF